PTAVADRETPTGRPSRGLRPSAVPTSAYCAMTEQSQNRRCTAVVRAVSVTYRPSGELPGPLRAFEALHRADRDEAAALVPAARPVVGERGEEDGRAAGPGGEPQRRVQDHPGVALPQVGGGRHQVLDLRHPGDRVQIEVGPGGDL